MMAPLGVPGLTKTTNLIYEPTPRVRVRAEYMSDAYEALGRVIETVSRAGKENDAVESVAWDQFKDSAQRLTGDMRKVRRHYGNAVEEFGRFVTESGRLHLKVTDLIASYNLLVDELLLLRSQHSSAVAASTPTAHDVLSTLSADPVSGNEQLQERIDAGRREAAGLSERIAALQAEAEQKWDSIGSAERRQQELADAAASALAGAREASGLNDGLWGNLGAFLAGLLDVVISVLKIIVMVLLVVLTLVTLILTPFIGPGPAAGLLLLTIFVAGALFVAQVVRAALEGLDFGAFMAAIGAAALHFGAVVLGAFLGGVAGAFIKGLLGSLGPVIAGAVAAAVRTAVQSGVTTLVDETLVEGLLELGGPEARQLYDELVNSPAGQFLEVQAAGFGGGFADTSGVTSMAENAGGALGEALEPMVDAAGDIAGGITDAAAAIGGGLDEIFGTGSTDLLRDAGVDIGGDILRGENAGDALVGGLRGAATDWLEQRVDSFLDHAESLADGLPGDVLGAFDDAGLGGLEGVLNGAGLGELLDYGQALANGQDPLSLAANVVGVGGAPTSIEAWIPPGAREEVMAAAAPGGVTMSWIGTGDD